MKVIDFEPQSWFLLTDGTEFFLDVNCNYFFVGFSKLILLDEAESAQYKSKGKLYIDDLAADVQNRALTSYQNRNATPEIEKSVYESIMAFNAQNDHR
jgi:hypothetical protein